MRENIDLFLDLVDTYRMQFGFKVHTQTKPEEVTIEVKCGNDRIVHVVDEEEDNAYRRAYEDLDFRIKLNLENIEAYISEFRGKMEDAV